MVRSNRVNTDTGEVSVKRVMFYKSTLHLLFEHKTKEIKQDIKIVKLDISNLENVVICRLQMFMKTLKRRSFIHYLIQNRSLHNSSDTNIVWNWRFQFMLSGAL